MPYIKPELRSLVAKTDKQSEISILSVGQLTYKLFQILVDSVPEEPRYEDYARALAAVEAAKLEFYRVLVAPYEHHKAQENGYVHPRQE